MAEAEGTEEKKEVIYIIRPARNPAVSRQVL
jgi:hypothetical protein